MNILTANPDTWSKAVLLINYDENDCFFDHMPPPCPPSPTGGAGEYYGSSTVSTTGEYLIANTGTQTANVMVTANAYRTGGPWCLSASPS